MSEFVDDDDACKVRAAIVERYHRGPDGLIEPWEDASFIVYQVTDRYGFLHKNPLPQYEKDEKMLELERDRVKKWLKMFSNWKYYFSIDRCHEKLRRRVFKGIPDSIRGEAWKKMLNLEKFDRTGVYEQFREFALQNSPDIRQIDLDVNRTYRDHIMFRDRFSVKQQALFNVLAAYSVYNTDVGYCQGMSGITALLLMYMNEEDAFWALSELFTDRKHAMHGLFIPGFPKLLRFQNHHDKLFKKLIPKMYKHFEKEGVHNSLYTLKWFMQVFLDRLPFSLVLRVYDIFILEGDYVLTVTAYHILKIFKRQLVKMDLETLASFLQEGIPNYVFVDDDLIESLQESMQELKKAKLDVPPPPSSNEIPSKPPTDLPDRNTFATASKRARMLKEKKVLPEIPIGKSPSPELTESRKELNGTHNSVTQEGRESFDKANLRSDSKKSSRSTSPKQIPSYSEFVEQKLQEQDNSTTQSYPPHFTINKDRSPTNPGKSKFYMESSYQEDVIRTEKVVSSAGQNWSTEVHISNNRYPNVSNSSSHEGEEADKVFSSFGEKVTINGYSRADTLPRDDLDAESEMRGRRQMKLQERKGTAYKLNYALKDQYATETRL